MQSWRIPRTLSVLVVVFVGFSIIFSLGGLMVLRRPGLLRNCPVTSRPFGNKVESLRGLTGGSGTLERASKVLKDLKTELQNSETGGQPGTGSPLGSRPINRSPLKSNNRIQVLSRHWLRSSNRCCHRLPPPGLS